MLLPFSVPISSLYAALSLSTSPIPCCLFLLASARLLAQAASRSLPLLRLSGRRTNVSRAAGLIAGFAELAGEVQTGALEPEMAGKNKLCSNGYKFLFNSCRVPEPNRDAVRCHDPAASKVAPTHRGCCPPFCCTLLSLICTPP